MGNSQVVAVEVYDKIDDLKHPRTTLPIIRFDTTRGAWVDVDRMERLAGAAKLGKEDGTPIQPKEIIKVPKSAPKGQPILCRLVRLEQTQFSTTVPVTCVSCKSRFFDQDDFGEHLDFCVRLRESPEIIDSALNQSS
jgi:hypothetical protein